MQFNPTRNGNANLSLRIMLHGALITLIIVGPLSAQHISDRAAGHTLSEIMPTLRVSSSQKIAQQTPIATHKGNVYIVNIESGDSGDEDDINLHTVIRRGETNSEGQWLWSDKTLDKHTIYDPWHTSPAVGIDSAGFVHVAYNMHNFPWQYSVSDLPDSINSFTFAGDEMSIEEREKAKYENKTSFKTMGYAAIPGNQITYPAFYNDAAGALHVTYRYAAKPARRFKDRTMSAGIAKHDVKDNSWQSLGGILNSTREDYETSWFKKDKEPLAIASQIGWTAYHPRMTFDGNNQAYLFFYWREGVAGETLIKPCIITTSNFKKFTTLQGDAITLPVKPKDCSNISTESDETTTYNTIGSIASDSNGTLYIVISPTEEHRKILTFTQGVWSSEDAPGRATEIFVDQADTLWAISSGLNIYKKQAGESDWKNVIKAKNRSQCYPKVSLNESKSKAFLYSQSCDDSNTVSVHSLNLTPSS